MHEAMQAMRWDAGEAYWKAFRPHPTDVIISPYAKSGTTWLQQIVHTLRTRGDMEFDDISRVVPWLETAQALGIDLEAPQRGCPRAFKSHLDWHTIPKGARYLVSFRDPKDALVSSYRFMEGWFFAPGSISIESWTREEFIPREPGTGYWHHLASWWEQRHNSQVLLLCYEEMKRDLAGSVRTIANFLAIPLDGELEAITLRHASLDFMLRHKDKFDDRMMRERSEQVAGLPPGSDSAKVRRGEVGSHRNELSEEIRQALDEIWRNEIECKFGFASYEALRQAVRSLRQ
jgi:hypothetical protein